MQRIMYDAWPAYPPTNQGGQFCPSRYIVQTRFSCLPHRLPHQAWFSKSKTHHQWRVTPCFGETQLNVKPIQIPTTYWCLLPHLLSHKVSRRHMGCEKGRSCGQICWVITIEINLFINYRIVVLIVQRPHRWVGKVLTVDPAVTHQSP